jgi:hypothetical protein
MGTIMGRALVRRGVRPGVVMTTVSEIRTASHWHVRVGYNVQSLPFRLNIESPMRFHQYVYHWPLLPH